LNGALAFVYPPAILAAHLREAEMKARASRVHFLVLSLSLVLSVLSLSAMPAEGVGATSVSMPAPVPCNQSAGHCWTPSVKARWQYQLQGSPAAKGGCRYKSTGFVNIGVTGTSFATGRTVAPVVFDIDILQDGKCYSPQDYSVLNYAAVQALHVRGARVIGYIDAGTAETWRPDFPEMQAFDQSCDGCLFGNPLSNFPDEYWLNINTDMKGINPNTGKSQTTRAFLLEEMQARVKEAKLIGVDAIEFDDVDSYQSHSGFSISAAAQLRYNAALANLAHRQGLSVGLKNDRDQAEALQPYFDFGIEEECWQYDECGAMQSWPLQYGKAVFDVEYESAPAAFCPQSNSPAYDFNSIRKTDDLFDLPYTPCR
jgi:Glycoside-hydrolase family GH114